MTINSAWKMISWLQSSLLVKFSPYFLSKRKSVPDLSVDDVGMTHPFLLGKGFIGLHIVVLRVSRNCDEWVFFPPD